MVAPFTGAWIEIVPKSAVNCADEVAPFTGAWIEIEDDLFVEFGTNVAPFTGAWIEIIEQVELSQSYLSLPSRGRGLKY